jgi:rubrerythrin
MADLSFYYCTACGIMSMKNFRDDACPVCKVAMKVNKVNIYFDEPAHLEELPAPHEEKWLTT